MDNSAIETCLICFDDIEIDNIVWFTFDPINISNNQLTWKRFPYCIDCINHLKATQWDEYIESVRNADCERALRNLIELGPPKNIRDASITENREISAFRINEQIISAILDNALTMEEINELKKRLYGVIIILDMYNNNELDVDTECLVDVMNIVNQILDDY